MSKKKQSFVQGALILMLSNIIVKVGGALFKIPLANAIGDNAMGYFSFAYSIYSMCFLIATAGLPVAISRLIASSLSQKRTKEADKIYRVSLRLFIIIGFTATLILFFGADAVAKIANSPNLSVCIRTISPIMFFVCMVSTFRGYFQGHQNMIPTATSQVIEVSGNLLLGLSAGMYASRSGYSAPVVASFALGGITVGMVLSAIYMIFAKTVAKKDSEIGMDTRTKSGKEIASELISIAIPITISSSILSLTSIIDSMLAVGKLGSSYFGSNFFPLGNETSVAMSLYGAYQAKAVTFFNLPTTIITPFAVSIIPTISGSLG
ncbi:MAG: oligosaccharide flippase family protein, partial [Clostridia bacterium]|nr:oligosaccharide flippase family protein [Clostridia bacterium]